MAAVALGIVALVAACADEEPPVEDDDLVDESPDFQIQTEVNAAVDFSQYATFDIIDPTNHVEGDPPERFRQIQAELNDAIIKELRAEGLTRDTEAPQLLVTPFVNRGEVAVSRERFYEAYYGWYWGYEFAWVVSYDYAIGSLVIDVVDRRQPDSEGDDLLVFRGVAHGLLAADSEVIDAQIEPLTDAMFDAWPGTSPQSP